MKRLRALLARCSRRGVAHALVLLGAAVFALGAGLVYLPAGVLVAGVALAVWALLVFDVEPRE